jgi:hypothetical protein
MTLNEAVDQVLTLRSRLSEVLGGGESDSVKADLSVLLDRLEHAKTSAEQLELLDRVLTLCSPYKALRAELAPVHALLGTSRYRHREYRTGRHGDTLGSAASGHGGGGGEQPPPDEQVSASTPAVVERWPHLDVDAGEPIAQGERFIVSVYLDCEGLRPGESGGPILLPDIPNLELRVWLTTSHHFEVQGKDTTTITLRSGEERSTEAKFEVSCVGAGDGNPGMTATFACNGCPAGSVSRRLRLTDVPEPAAGSEALPPPGFRADAKAREHDLVVTVLQDPDGDERHFVVTVCSPWLNEYQSGVRARWHPREATEQIVKGYMDAFVTSSVAGRTAALIGAGKALFRAAPQVFQEVFWKLVDSGEDLNTIFIVSSEPHVPWELMIPTRDDEERKALGVEFSVGRWVHAQLISPEQAIGLDDSYVIAPKYTGDEALAFSEDEATYVVGRFRGQEISPALIKTIDDTLRGRGATLLHFICHGFNRSGGQALKLDVNEELEAQDVLREFQLEGMQGAVHAIRESKPFVFINACEVGHPMPALVGTGGFAEVFTRLGARGVIAPIWSVEDSVASVVARRFYEEILPPAPKPFGTAMQEIRRLAYEGTDPKDSYAAYCFYGDPLSAVAPST